MKPTREEARRELGLFRQTRARWEPRLVEVPETTMVAVPVASDFDLMSSLRSGVSGRALCSGGV